MKTDTKTLSEEALKRGIKINYIEKFQRDIDFMEFSFKNHFEYIRGERSSKTSCIASYTLEDKAQTKYLLSRRKISVATGKLFHKSKVREVYKFIKEIGYPLVIKINDGAHGNFVFIGINNKKDCEKSIACILKKNNYFLVEKEFKGMEFRFLATTKKVLAVAYRNPPHITGDGIHNIKELIKIKNSYQIRGEFHKFFLTKIKIDNIIKQNLIEQKMKLDHIPNKGEKVYLRKGSNISTGGDSDVTDQVHPELKKIAVKAVRAIPGLAYAGVDLMTNKDISKKPTKSSYIIIELNSSPGLRMHHFPVIGKPRNVAKGIIDILFPETKGKYVGE